MTSRTQFILELLDKLGSPLLASVTLGPQGRDSAEGGAAQMASLMSESVKAGISLTQAMNIKPEDGDTDAIRVALASIAAGLVAGFYQEMGRAPSESDAQKITNLLESVIVFADNFSPSPEHAARLVTLAGDLPFFDAAQGPIYALHALLPVLTAVQQFSFGQSETRLVAEVAEKLQDRAASFRARFGIAEKTMADLVVLRSLARLYAAVHRAETARLRAGVDQQQPSLAPVWEAFDRQVEMAAVLLESLGGQGRSDSGRGNAGDKAPAVQQETPSAPSATSSPATVPPAGGSPMSFFRKK